MPFQKHDILIEKLVIVVSTNDERCFQEHVLNALKTIGTSYTLIRTDPNISCSKSFNSILKYKNLKNSKYIIFMHHDIDFLEEDWGKKIIDYCDSLSDFGSGGVECITEANEPLSNGLSRGRPWGKHFSTPTEIETCDGGIHIVPTQSFFDSSI